MNDQTLKQSTINPAEIAKFAQHASLWWDEAGPLKTLHDINPVRLDYIQKITSLKEQRVLDIGCGGGILTEGMAKCGAKVVGIDAEPNVIQIAKEHAINNELKIQYRCVPIELFKAKPFKIITCLEMLEHVDDPLLVIQQAARLLAPGGTLILSTINRTLKAYAGVIWMAEYVLGILPKQTHDYQKFIKPSELAGFARMAGLEVIDITGLAYHPLTRTASLTPEVGSNYLMACSFSH